jgi:hypothetical protein
MYYHVSITARNSRDESCDLYRLTWHFDVNEAHLTPSVLSDMINEVKDKYLISWPMRGVAAPSKAFIPVDVEIVAIRDSELTLEPVPGEGKAA